MKKYEPDDLCTFYFVIWNSGDTHTIQGWSDDKDLVKAYMEFHHCKRFELKSRSDTYDNMCRILEENTNDEISVYNLLIKDDNHKKGHESKMIAVPLTYTEMTLVKSENTSYLASRIDYSYINDAMYYLKEKYVKCLQDIFLPDVIGFTILNKPSKFTDHVYTDELRVLFHSYPDHFGM